MLRVPESFILCNVFRWILNSNIDMNRTIHNHAKFGYLSHDITVRLIWHEFLALYPLHYTTDKITRQNNISHYNASDMIGDEVNAVVNVNYKLGIKANVVDSSPAVQPTIARVE